MGRKKYNMTFQGIIPIAIVFAVFSGFGLLGFWYYSTRDRAVLSWHTTTCTILESELEVNESTGTGGYGTSYSFIPKISYKYQVNGADYEGTRYYIDNNFFKNREEVEEIVAELPAGTHITCYFNPENPADSVIKRRGRGFGAWNWYGALIFFVLSIIAIVFLSIQKYLK